MWKRREWFQWLNFQLRVSSWLWGSAVWADWHWLQRRWLCLVPYPVRLRERSHFSGAGGGHRQRPGLLCWSTGIVQLNRQGARLYVSGSVRGLCQVADRLWQWHLQAGAEAGEAVWRPQTPRRHQVELWRKYNFGKRKCQDIFFLSTKVLHTIIHSKSATKEPPENCCL